MNMRRLVLAAVVAWVAFVAIGFVVNTILLRDVYLQNASALRPEADMNRLVPFGLGAGLLGFLVFAYVYAKGYEGGNGVQEGLRFGVLVALLIACFAMVWNYIVFPISGTMAVYGLIDLFIEFSIYGMIVGALYKPRTSAP